MYRRNTSCIGWSVFPVSVKEVFFLLSTCVLNLSFTGSIDNSLCLFSVFNLCLDNCPCQHLTVLFLLILKQKPNPSTHTTPLTSCLLVCLFPFLFKLLKEMHILCLCYLKFHSLNHYSMVWDPVSPLELLSPRSLAPYVQIQ